MTTIGVLALQGAFIEHVHVLERLGVDGARGAAAAAISTGWMA